MYNAYVCLHITLGVTRVTKLFDYCVYIIYKIKLIISNDILVNIVVIIIVSFCIGYKLMFTYVYSKLKSFL